MSISRVGFISLVATAAISIPSALQNVSAAEVATIIENVGSSTMRTGEVPAFNAATGRFGAASGPGVAMRFRALGGHPQSADFMFTRHSATFAPGRPPDESMIWGYNMNGGGGVERPGETGLGWVLEGHYEPVAGTAFTEAHLYYVTKAGVQQRPFTLRINKDNPEDHVMALNGRVWFRSPTGNTDTAWIGPDNAGYRFRHAAGKGVQFADDGYTFQLQRTGGPGAMTFQGFTYVVLPGTVVHDKYLAISGSTFVFGNGGTLFTDSSGALRVPQPRRARIDGRAQLETPCAKQCRIQGRSLGERRGFHRSAIA